MPTDKVSDIELLGIPIEMKEFSACTDVHNLVKRSSYPIVETWFTTEFTTESGDTLWYRKYSRYLSMVN